MFKYVNLQTPHSNGLGKRQLVQRYTIISVHMQHCRDYFQFGRFNAVSHETISALKLNAVRNSLQG